MNAPPCASNAHSGVSNAHFRIATGAINAWEWVRVLRTRLVQAGVVDTHAPLPIAFRYHDHITEPCGVLDLFDESCLKKALNLFLCFRHLFRAHAPQLLCYGLATVDDGQLMAGKVRVYFWHVCCGPDSRNPYGLPDSHRQVHRIVSSNKE
ncbi:hypothetical protein PIB30_025412 [Stylosanthes scabra]|uniref:Uncharacterized protein n=1 Tax=Stylosanthes scabra TaxID=79078 RepID=A0ABU6RAK9_9FABA|nr:hypothetical protein [Stylosanthes scabra]